MFFGAFAVITGALVNMGIALAEHPDVRERARQEVQGVTPSGPLDLQTLTRLTYLTQVGKEVRRYYKLLPATFFARVTRRLRARRIPSAGRDQSHRLPPRDDARPGDVPRAADIRP